MSEFKCPEPGCNFHVGISNGPNLTEEDWESEQYYFQEIEEHERRHKADRDLALGKRIKEIRKAKGLSANALALRSEQLGFTLSRQSIANIETGRNGMSVENAVGLARALGLNSLDELITVWPTSRKKEFTPHDALAEIRMVLAQLDAGAKEVPPAGATAEGDETKTNR